MNCECFSAKKGYICETAAQKGHLDCLRYAHENGCPWNWKTCAHAAANGHLKCLKYAHENGCPCEEGTCMRAASYGHLDCLRYAHENGCPWDSGTVHWAISEEKWSCAIYAIENGCPYKPTDIPVHLKKTLMHRKVRRLFPVLAGALRQRGKNKHYQNSIIVRNKY